MQLDPLSAQRTIGAIFTRYSDELGDLKLTVLAGATDKVVDNVSTVNSRQVTVAINATGAGNITIRKYFSAGRFFIDSTVGFVLGSNEYSHTVLHEFCEIYVENTGIVPIEVSVTVIARP